MHLGLIESAGVELLKRQYGRQPTGVISAQEALFMVEYFSIARFGTEIGGGGGLSSMLSRFLLGGALSD